MMISHCLKVRMSGMINTYKKKHLGIEQQCVESIQNVDFGTYDLAFFCSSWDLRCIDVTNVRLELTRAIFVNLAYRDSDGMRDHADKEIRSYINQNSYELFELIQNNLSLPEVLETMCNNVDQICVKKSSPRILLDITGFPRYLSLGLIAYVIKSNLVNQIDVFYSEANYGDENEAGNILFTEGKWEALPIRLLEGEYSPCKDMYILVSTGFEGKKTYRAVCEREPDRISLLMPEPGFTEEITKRTRSENCKLIDQYKVPDEQVLCSPAADLVTTMKKLDMNLERFSEENVYYLCCGTKPHSLALALRSVLYEESAVIYNKPESYKFRPITHRGNFWLYQIQNLAVFL